VQEFVATYKVKVDEDGVRRLQSALEENRDTAESLASSFTAARGALASLKKEMSAPMSDYNFLGSHWTDQFKFPSLSGVMDGLSLPALKVDLDTSAAGEALSSFREQAEGMKPKVQVDATGVRTAVSSAVSSARSLLSSISLSLPVKATLDTSSLKSSVSSLSSSSSSSSSLRKTVATTSVSKFATGGRVSEPTFAMIGEGGAPEYVIPTDNDSRAVPLLRSLLSELSTSARSQILPAASAAPSQTVNSVSAPVTISVTATASQPEAVGRNLYDTTERSLLRALGKAL